jgi:hypothetical protein
MNQWKNKDDKNIEFYYKLSTQLEEMLLQTYDSSPSSYLI